VAIALVQVGTAAEELVASVTLDAGDGWATPTAGNLLVLWHTGRGDVTPVTPAGWTAHPDGLVELLDGFGVSLQEVARMSWKVSDGTESSITVTVTNADRHRISVAEFSGVSGYDAASSQPAANGTAINAGSVPPTSGAEALIVGGVAVNVTDSPNSVTPDSGWTELTDLMINDFKPLHWFAYRVVASASGTYAPSGVVTGAAVDYGGQSLAFLGTGGAPDPDPEPPPYVPPEPGQAIVEIYVDDPDGYRWDVAQWDEAAWAEAEWVSITEWCIFADVTWGADRPDAGILADQVAGNWVIETHDPDRVLDPANDESQFYPHLVPELPIRINHNSRTVRTGQVSIITYSHEREGGRISASDAVSRTSRADVPPGTALGDTFLERVTDAIDGAGIDLWVAFPSGELMDRPLASADIDARRSVWQRISEAARELLAVPWVDRDGHIRVTEWDQDTDRGLVIGSDQMVDLTPWVSHDGLYSVVRALDSDEVTIAEAAAAPLPPYGERVYERTEPTIDAVDWVTRVLADRQGAVLRYRPGTIRAWTAAQNDALVDMELMDVITLSYPETDPPIEVRARVLGARVRVTDRTKRYPAVLTRWEWTLLTTLVPSVPLIADGEADLTYLVSDEDGTTYLYPG
jgi:hypothetical protein